MFQQILTALWGGLWLTARKEIFFPTKPRVINTMVKIYFLKSFALVYIRHYCSTCGHLNDRFFYVNVFLLLNDLLYTTYKRKFKSSRLFHESKMRTLVGACVFMRLLDFTNGCINPFFIFVYELTAWHQTFFLTLQLYCFHCAKPTFVYMHCILESWQGLEWPTGEYC